MSPRIKRIIDELTKQTGISKREQDEITKINALLDDLVNHIDDLLHKMKDSKGIGKKVGIQENKKEKTTTEEKREVVDSLTNLNQGHLNEFKKIMEKMANSTGKKKELNESEIEELRTIYSTIFRFRNSIKTLDVFSGMILDKIKTLTVLLNIDEHAIIDEQIDQQGV